VEEESTAQVQAFVGKYNAPPRVPPPLHLPPPPPPPPLLVHVNLRDDVNRVPLPYPQFGFSNSDDDSDDDSDDGLMAI
jgi:predicted Zn-dependent peptidase